MYFTIRKKTTQEPDIFVKGERLKVVEDFKYLGVIVDSHLSFKKHIKKVNGRVKMNLVHFKIIRNQLTTEAAKLYFHSMILTHISYCLTTWSQANTTALSLIRKSYKKALKILDKKSNLYHHCPIIQKYGLFSLDNFISFSNCCLFFKIVNDLAPPPLKKCVSLSRAENNTRASSRGDSLSVFRRTTFGQSAFSVKTTGLWNSIPVGIRQSNTLSSFKSGLKKWLKTGQRCEHF